MKAYLLGVLLIITINSFAQKANDACKFMSNASEYYCEENYKKTIKQLKKFIKKYPKHSLNEEARYALGLCYQNLGKVEKATAEYVYLLENIEPREVDSFGYDLFECSYMQSECRNILIPDYLSSLQHEACLQLAEFEFNRKDYAKFHKYLKIAENDYRYWFGCGTGDYEEDMRMSILYSRYYTAIGQHDSAYKVMLPFVFEPAAFPNLQYPNIIVSTLKLLEGKYGHDKLVALFEEASENIIQENLSDNHHPSYRYYVLFDDVYIPASPMYLFEHNGSKKEATEFVRSTPFYKELMK